MTGNQETAFMPATASMEEFESLLNESLARETPEEGSVVKGKVVAIENGQAIIDVGFKVEGRIDIKEFAAPGKPAEIGVGDEVEVFLDRVENARGEAAISRERARREEAWDRLEKAYEAGERTEGAIVNRVKGGFTVDLGGAVAFLPGSQIDVRPVRDVTPLMGVPQPFQILKMDRRRGNIVVSRRAVLEEERERMKAGVLKDLGKDQIREGQVKNITDFGAFVDLGGIDGLLHITDMSWGRVSHPSEIVKIGDKVTVKVLNFDPEKERISLGLKQLTPYPWEGVDKKYPVGTRVHGKVVSITDYGAFVELEKGVEGLVHVSEMSWTRHVRHPSKVVSIGDAIEALVLKVDPGNEKISLGLKQVEPDPWLTLDDRFPIGSRVQGKVRNLTNFGAFVELEEGIDGLLHVSDLSWTKKIVHPSELLKKG
ncbi:MAG TPA: 30S ribosomal protein S1, partial [Thermohalobaculum sp.]|nr:30S ribosomal protein S1 [Thermohalobaculum sp.]